MKDRLLFIDTETGGINPDKHSLLSIGMVIWDPQKGNLYEREVYLKNKEYSITKSAIRINHINIAEHQNEAVSAKEAVEIFRDVKNSFFSDYSAIPLAGHNITFDIQFLRKLFADCNRSFEKAFLHRSVDTYSIMRFLVDCGRLPDTVKSSASAFNYFGIVVQGRHTALGDAIATMELYEKMLQIGRA